MSHESLQLFSYWRSSAAYRVRIGLNLKGLHYDIVPVSLVQDGGQQHSVAYRQVNPQELVPALRHGERNIRQSLAILEYLDEAWPGTPLLPATARDRARVRGLAQLVACDIHPLNNLRVLRYLEGELHLSQAQREAWIHQWIGKGFAALEQLLDDPATGAFCHGDTPGLADCCLVPQAYNARRFGVDMDAYPNLRRIEAACMELPAFLAAQPEAQPDAPAATR